MKAIVYDAYGPPDVLELAAVEAPSPAGHEVLIKVHAASVNAADHVLLRADPFLIRLMGMGLLKPKHKILGFDVAGRVEAIGPHVEAFQPGDEVFGTSHFGAFAELACVNESTLVAKPAKVSFEQAAAIPTAACTALQALQKGRIEPGQDVLIDGASGGVGTFAVQLAKVLGARVTAVCSTRNVAIARALGADDVIDYRREDFTQADARYDLIVAANAHRRLSDYARALKPRGRYVMSGGGGTQLLQVLFLGPWLSMRSGKKITNLVAKANKADLLYLRQLLEEGRIEPVIDRTYPLRDVPAAIRYLEEEHARGKVVISVASEP